MTRLQIMLEADDARGIATLAERLRLPSSATARLLLRVGLEAARQDPARLLAAPAAATGAA